MKYCQSYMLMTTSCRKEKTNQVMTELHKVPPLIEILQEIFANCAEEENQMAVDGQIVPFKRRHSLKVYMKKKTKNGATRFGH